MISIIIFFIALIFLVLFVISFRKSKEHSKKPDQQIIQQPIKINHGHLQIFYGSQTGTSAKMAQGFAQQAIQNGFEPEVIDLKDIQFNHFDVKGQISIFFLSNTGEGDAPDNTIKFMKVIKQKQQLDEVKVTDWNKIAFTVFGLGNTQYEFYNKVGIDADALLEKRGANRIYRLGLGDNNASLEDDYIEWKNDLWQALKQYRSQNPLQKRIQQKSTHSEQISQKSGSKVYLTAEKPQLANWKFVLCPTPQSRYPYQQEDLDFKTKASLKSQQTVIKNIKQVRQNTNDGSTLAVQVELEGQPQYQTAGNIALYPQNDPKIVEQIIHYFNLTKDQLDSYVSIQKLEQDKKLKLNFIPYVRLYDLLASYIDIQGRLTKSVLKKLSKFQSKSAQYFTANSSPKTTAQFKRITEDVSNSQNWYYLFRIIKEQQVKINIEDFVELSDSIAPRLFTIGSSYKKQKNVIVMASIVDGGLVSKFLISKPENMRAELRKSTFTNAMQWKKVILIGAGTGFAPFRGFLQQKQVLMQRVKNGQAVSYPQLTLFFGCKRSHGDFIYKEQIENWVSTEVINRFHGAFSREKPVKVYVQHLIQQNSVQIKKYLDDQNSAIYICGSLGMGHDVSQALSQMVGHQTIKSFESNGRIIKELW